MKRYLLYFILSLMTVPFSVHAQTSLEPVLTFIRTKAEIKEGGCDFFEYKGQSLLIAVAPVTVGSKSEQNCQKVGSAKAKKEMLSFINGSEITSVTSLETSESVEESLSGRKVESTQVFTEKIRETVLGTINMTNPLGGWYSEDKSLYYYAIYKTIE